MFTFFTEKADQNTWAALPINLSRIQLLSYLFLAEIPVMTSCCQQKSLDFLVKY